MAKRVVIKNGDIFEVRLKNDLKGYFQYIGLDLTQLNSEVIRVFKKRYHVSDSPAIEEIVKDEVEFFAHVVIKFGVRNELWQKIGKYPVEGERFAPKFRASKDYGKPEIKKSRNWEVWEMNKEFQFVGPLYGEARNYDLGVVVIPQDVVDKMQLGEYQFVHPGLND